MISGLSATTKFDDFAFCGFPGTYFTSIQSYSHLMVAEEFYTTFADYEYILIYQLDCLVFSNELARWCCAGWDYIGAPWFKDFSEETAEGLWAVGNGGLSLRKVTSALDVLRLARIDENDKGRPLRELREDPEFHEDIFWSFYANKISHDFNIASPTEALAFSFETAPRHCFELNMRRLPFGCHAWTVYDRSFWGRYLLR